MEGLRFLFGVIVSPPWESSEAELENFYQNTLKYLISVAYRFPDIPLTMFISGPFLEWLEIRHSEFLTALLEMVRRKQVEMLGGGYYGPLLALLPPSDRLGQIEELTTLVRRLVGRRPRGGWLPKMIWDPSLVLSLTGSGLEYTFLDEEDFESLGIPSERLGLPCVTENQGRLITCIPVNGQLSDEILLGNFDRLDQVIWSRFGDSTSVLAVFLSLTDLENKPFFARSNNGLEALFEALRSNYPGMICVNPTSYLKKVDASFERAYFAPSNYASLCRRVGVAAPSSADRQSWRQFLTDFEASNRLYSKMIHVHLVVSSLRGDKFKKKSALEELWKGQSLRAYVPDGHLARSCRHRAFQALVGAEALVRDPASFQSALTALDFDLDGIQEFLFQGKNFNLFIDPVGGQGFEWDWFDKPWNWADVDPGAVSDSGKLFNDRLFAFDSPDVDVTAFSSKEFKLSELDRDQMTLVLSAVADLTGAAGPLRLKKTFAFDDEGVTLGVELELLSGKSWSGWYVSDSQLYCESPEKAYFFSPDGVQAGLKDQGRGAEFLWHWSPEAQVVNEVCHFPESQGFLEYRSHQFTLRWRVDLEVGESWRAEVRWDLH